MRWERSAAARTLAMLLSLCAGLAVGRAAPAAGPRDLGILEFASLASTLAYELAVRGFAGPVAPLSIRRWQPSLQESV
jgi:hypothetical protein